MKSRLRSYLVLGLTVALMYLVIRRVGLDNLLATIRDADLLFVLLSFALSPLLIISSVIKWQILLRSRQIEVPLHRLCAFYMVGYFFNHFLPSNVGGDVMRGYELGDYTNNKTEAMASVFIDRLTGLIMMVVLALLSFITHMTLVQDVRLVFAMGVAVVALIGILWLILDARPLAFIANRVTLPFVQKYITKLQKFHASLNAYREHKQTLAYAFVWSFIFMVGAILNVYVSASAFHPQPISFVDIAVITPIILVVAMMPLTFNGIGIQEWAYVLLFTWIGLPASVGLSTIVLIRAKNILSALIGGGVYLHTKYQKRSVLISGSAE